MAIKLIVLDLDGTLLKTKWQVDRKSLKVIERVYQERPEIKIVIATGRAPGATIKHAQKIQIHQKASHIICYNGGSIFDISNNKLQVLYSQYLTKAEVATIYQFAKTNRLHFWGYGTDGQTAYVDRKSIKVWIIEHFNRLKKTYINENNFVDLYKILLFCRSQKAVTAMAEALKKTTKLEISTSSKHIPVIEVNPIGVNKAAAVQFLCQKWDIKPSEVLACGDGMNDYKLIKWAKYGIAMENAFDELKDVAYDVTASNKKGGVGMAINKYVFGEDKS